MRYFVKRINNLSFWIVFPAIVFIFFLIPVLAVLSSLIGDYSDNWSHLYNFVLFDYIKNSLFLVVGVSLITLIVGTGTAWLVSNFNFFGKRFFEWALILPLSIPPYILAYTFTGLFDSYGTLNNLVRNIFELDQSFIFFPNIRNIFGAIIVFSFTLYPYVYLVSRSAFLNQSRTVLESGRILGLSRFEISFKLSMPMIRPAIIGGLMLVIMETLSDFGAVEHFAIPTFTTGIFRTWFGMGDLTTAMQLSSFLLLFICIFIFIENRSRKNAEYVSNSTTHAPIKIEQLSKNYSMFAFIFCFLPLLIGFILPVTELIVWAIYYNPSFFNNAFLTAAMNTITLALIAAILCSIISILINFSIRINRNSILKFLSSLLSLGYALPGLILAVGIVQTSTYLDSSLLEKTSFAITGSLFGLVLAYIIKSYALSNNTISSGMEKISSGLDDSARILKSTGWNLLGRIHFPLLKTSFFTSILLVTSEVVKELPATLILRPFNYDTLAVSTYIYAAEERMRDAAAPSIAIILVGLIPIIIITRMIRSSQK
jgi:iron(III) transport system permease protein|tara:strand:- start:777 stop:2399 length:1623 start_codon:yes stop_codon:yes gene_type:complete